MKEISARQAEILDSNQKFLEKLERLGKMAPWLLQNGTIGLLRRVAKKIEYDPDDPEGWMKSCRDLLPEIVKDRLPDDRITEIIRIITPEA